MPKRYIIGEEVIEETPSVRIVALRLSEEALAGLVASCGSPKPERLSGPEAWESILEERDHRLARSCNTSQGDHKDR